MTFLKVTNKNNENPDIYQIWTLLKDYKFYFHLHALKVGYPAMFENVPKMKEHSWGGHCTFL